MVRRKWLCRIAWFLAFFALFPGGMSGPVPAGMSGAPVAHASGHPVDPPAPVADLENLETVLPDGAPDALLAEGPAEEPAGAPPLAGTITDRLAAERPGLSGEVRQRIAAAIAREAGDRAVDPWLVYAVIDVESDFIPDARGGSGERGLMQVLPSTGRGVQRLLAPDEPALTPEELEDADVNVRIGTAYLADLLKRYDGDEGRALTAYNSGRDKGAPSPYARRVLARYARYTPVPAEVPAAAPAGRPAGGSGDERGEGWNMNDGVGGGQTPPLGREDAERLLGEATRAAERAYAPYSGLLVGAAVLGMDGRTFSGCNVENASYGLSICAERVAAFKAVSEGVRKLRAVAVTCRDGPAIPPCGACCQVLAELNPGMQVILPGANGEPDVTTLDRYLAVPFRPDHLAGRRGHGVGPPGAAAPLGGPPGTGGPTPPSAGEGFT